MSTDFLKSARKAKSAGDMEGAGDFFLLAGRPREAVESFLAGDCHIRAAETLESQGDVKQAAELYEKGGQKRKAAELFEGLGDLERAAGLYVAADDSYRAARAYERAGKPQDAARLYHELGDLTRAAQLYLEGGEPAHAGEMYEELWLNRNREDPRHGVRSLLPAEKIAEAGARAWLKAGEPEKAALFFTRAELHEKAAEAFASSGDMTRAARAFRKAGRPELAVDLLEKVEELEDSATILLAEICLDAGKAAKAAAYFEQAGKLREAAVAYEAAGDSMRAGALYAMIGERRRAGDLFREAGDLAGAARAYEEAGHLEAAATAYEEAGNVRRAADLALRMYRKVRSEPSSGGRARMLAMGKRAADLAMLAGGTDHAAEIYAEIGLAREAASAYSAMGLFAKAAEQIVRVGEFAEARSMLVRANLPVPPLVEGGYFEMNERYVDAARVYERAGELERAAQLFLRGGSPGQAGRVYEQLQDFVKAAECHEAAADPARAGHLYQRAGLLEKAAECLERGGDLERAAYVHLLAENFLSAAKVFVKARKLDDALVLLQKIKPGHADYAEGCLLLGDIFFEKELFSLALDKYFKGLQDRPVDEKVLGSLYNLARTYESLERHSEARECYEKILAVDFGYRDARQRREAALAEETRPRLELRPSDTMPLSVPPISGSSSEGSSRFEIKGMLETDDIGTFLRAWDKARQRPVMLRRLDAPEQDPMKVERLLREAKKATALQHAHVLAVYEVGDEGGTKFVSMEYVEGTTLRARLDAGEKFDPYRAADIVAQIAMALEHAHRQNIVHRNLRPDTIMVLASGDVAKVRDFGFADRLTDTLRATGEKRHPLTYMAPEQILGRRIDERSDGYSLGVILYELLFGRPPFTGEDIIYQHVSRPVTFPGDGPKIPDRLRRVVSRCLEKEPARRFQTAREIADELRRAEVAPGTLIEGRYEVQAEIGSGGMGKVYRAWDRELDEQVALKILKAEFGENSDAVSRFLREIKLSRKIAHPNVVKVYDMGRFRGSRYISMEFIEGPSLDQWIRERGRIQIEPALSIVRAVLSALQAAHELGIIHRDVKPQNVLLAGGTLPKIVDFGIARGQNTEGVTLSGEVLGSPKYMAPEHIEEGTLDRRADLYSLGVLMYLLLTGREPFTGENPTAILLKHIHEVPKRPAALNPEIPPWVEAIVLKCLAKDPARRYQWASEVLADLETAGR